MANLSNFEENTEANEDKRDRLAVSVQTSVNSNVMNKMTLSEANGMDVDEEISNKNIKTHPQDELTILEEISSEVKKKFVQMHQYYFGYESKTKSSSCYKSKTELMSSYADKEMQSSEETKNLLPQVRKLINQKTSLISTRDAERNTLKFVVVSDKKVSEMEVKLDKISVLDKI